MAWPGKNMFSVDVEDYFHASALAEGVRAVGKDKLQHRVFANTERLLKLLDEAGVEGTFFVLGWVAERYPQLVTVIHDAGHEIACHGYSHSIIYEQSQEDFREETEKAKRLLEDAIGEQVLGYRAASFSITSRSLWALDTLAECGFSYDSSIFPVRHDRYGIPDANPVPHRLDLQNGASIVEVPMTAANYAGINIPVSGGGYFRLFPYWFSRMSARRVNRANRPWVFYVHPWELDPGQPRLPVKGLSRFRHYNNLEKTEQRLRKALADFEFESMRSSLAKAGLLGHSNACEESHTGVIADSR